MSLPAPANKAHAHPMTSVRWSQFFSFELGCGDDHALRRARAIFGPWRCNTEQSPLIRWRVQRLQGHGPGGSDAWEVSSDRDPEPLLRPDLSRALVTVEYLSVQALVTHERGPISFHGALVARGDRGALLLGPSEAGKSTLACALWQRGYALLSDDTALVDTCSGQAGPAPRRVALRAPSRALLGEGLLRRVRATPSYDPTAEGWLFHPCEVDGRPRSATVRLSTAVFLARRGARAGPAELARMEPAHALLSLLPYSNLASRVDMGSALKHLRPLASSLPVYDLGRGPLDAMVHRIDRILEGAS